MSETIDLTLLPGRLECWSCTIGEAELGQRIGVDMPMRNAVAEAYERITGEKPKFIFSGWGAELTEPQRAVVEDRLPSEEYRQQWLLREAAPDLLAACEVAEKVLGDLTRDDFTNQDKLNDVVTVWELLTAAIARAKGGE